MRVLPYPLRTDNQAVHDDVDILNHHRITDIMCLIGVRYVQEFRVTLVQAAA